MKEPFKQEHQIEKVGNFEDLISTPFSESMNAICWERELQGDFNEIVDKLPFGGNMKDVSVEELNQLELTENAQVARKILLQDMQLLTDHGASPVLNLIKNYDRDDFFFPTDVYSYHVDHSPIPSSTFLCTYHGASSDILPNAQAEQKILVPEIRNKLKKYYEGSEDGFAFFLSEHFFDLHYQPKKRAEPINLGTGHLWRLAVDHPEGESLPCIHRAPEEDDVTRLLLIC